jgi:16S rRNA (guanine527-N7)-methyltransferase|tara:strand:- start:4 stop:618 length:615 start_codon:yes stop_codon:yes gene_type:complete
MNEEEAKKALKDVLKFTDNDLNRLEIFRILLLEYNIKYNLISKSTENSIWARHILDSAQLLKYFSISAGGVLADLGTGAGFPGVVLDIFNKNPEFHVKLFEKSPIKRDFLNTIKKKINIRAEIIENVYQDEIAAEIIVCRAFKKLDKIIKISRETVKKPHKILILKGKNAQAEINNVSLPSNYSYKLENSITSIDSKIIIVKAK